MKSTKTLRRRLYIVTFDIPGARGGDPRYRRVDHYLRMAGIVRRPSHQIRLIVTGAGPSVIGNAIRSRIGPAGGVMVLRVGRFSAVDVQNPAVRREIRRLIRLYGRP